MKSLMLLSVAVITVLLVGCAGVTQLNLTYQYGEQKEDPQPNKGTVNIYPFKDDTPKDPDHPNYIGAYLAPLGNRIQAYTMQTDISSYVTDAFSRYLKANGYDAKIISPALTAGIAQGVIVSGEVKGFFIKDQLLISPIPFVPASHNFYINVAIKVKIIGGGGDTAIEKDLAVKPSSGWMTKGAGLLHLAGGTGRVTLEDKIVNLLNIGLTDVFQQILTDPEIEQRLKSNK